MLALLGAPPENYYNAANRLFAAGQFSQAEKMYQRVWQRAERPSLGACLRGKPSTKLQFQALYNAGNAAFLQAHWALAIQDYEAALRLDGADEDAWNNLGLAQARLQGPAGEQARPQSVRQQNRARETAVPADIFSLPPAALADYIQGLTQAGYPFRPGSSLKPAVTPTGTEDEVDW